MRSARGWGVAVGVAAASVLGFEPDARACSWEDCSGLRVVPEADGAAMPANAAGLALAGSQDILDQLVLVDVEAGVELPFGIDDSGPFPSLIPIDPLVADREYRIDVPQGPCDLGPWSRTFMATAEVEFPTDTLGVLLAQAPEHGMVEVPESVSCSIHVPAVSVRIELELDPLVEPFADVLMYETLVDGEPWSHQTSLVPSVQFGRSWIGRGVDELFATCPGGGSDGLALGVHQVQMIARIPGLPGTVLESDTVEIELECPPEEMGDDDEDDGSETGSFTVPLADDVEERSGCGCSAAGQSRAADLLAPALLLLMGRRRRRASRVR